MEKTAFIRIDINSVTWSELVTAFNEQYFPEPVIQQKALEFNNLTQGSETVREYARRFLQLERFSPGSMDNEKARCSKFFWGLRFELRDRIANIPRINLNDVINAATNHELILEQEKIAKKGSLNPKPGVPTQNVPKAANQQIGNNQNNNNKRKMVWKCKNCGKEQQGSVPNQQNVSTAAR